MGKANFPENAASAKQCQADAKGFTNFYCHHVVRLNSKYWRFFQH